MDQSLDEYINKKSNKRSPVITRVGVKRSPVVRKTIRKETSFKVTGLGKIKGFDARQRLSNASSIPDARITLTQKKRFKAQKITAPGAGDARSKLISKTKFIDARVRIENKKAQSQDLRVKVENPLARVADARANITFKRQHQQSQQKTSAGPKIRVTGLGKPPAFRVTSDGGLTKTIRTTSQQPETTDLKSLPGNTRTPIIKIKNEHYKPPSAPTQQTTALQIPVRTTSRIDQSVFSRAVAETFVQQAPPAPRHEPVYHVPPQTIAQPIVQYEYAQVAPEPVYPQYVTISASAPPPQPHAYINPGFGVPAAPTATSARLGKKRAPVPQKAVTSSGSQSQYRVLITNLHAIVSQDDIVELFGAVGALKRARVVKPGTAEVVYLNKQDALAACRKYHNRELDGQPMQVQMTSSTSASRRPEPVRVSQSPSPPLPQPPARRRSPPPPARRSSPPPARRSPPSSRHDSREFEDVKTDEKSVTHEPLKLGKDAPPCKLANVDLGLINKALFKVKGPGPSRPVTFTVKI